MSESVRSRPEPKSPILKTYGIIFFDSASSALYAREEIIALAEKCDQLNVVIRAEGTSQEAALLALHAKVKVFSGNAWWIIHERRKADGWYDSPQE
jgi:hypothetical protein